MKREMDSCYQKDVTNKNNEVRVNNSLQLTINLGDTLQVAALVLGVYLLSRFFANKEKTSGSIRTKEGKRDIQPEEWLLQEPMPISKYSIH